MAELTEKQKEAREKPGGSNVGDYPNVKSSDFCGPSGGAPEGSYPVNTPKRAKSALKLAHNAPNPEGIRQCVLKKYPHLDKKADRYERKANKKSSR